MDAKTEKDCEDEYGKRVRENGDCILKFCIGYLDLKSLIKSLLYNKSTLKNKRQIMSR